MAQYKVHDSINKKKRELLDSLGDDILRYVAELVTNSDDSYRREEKRGNMLTIYSLKFNNYLVFRN